MSEAYAKSRGHVSFPSVYAPGYAFLASKVYGHQAGEIFGETGVRLWLPARALRSADVALNHLFGIGPHATYLVLSNTRPTEVTTEIVLDADVLKLHAGAVYSLTLFRPDGRVEPGELRDGKLRVVVGPESLLAVKIHGLSNTAALPPLAAAAPGPAAGRADYFRQETGGGAGTVTGMVLRFNDRLDAYLYTDATERQARKITLKYRLGDATEAAIEDAQYPFEFSIPLASVDVPLKARLIAEIPSGQLIEIALPVLHGSP